MALTPRRCRAWSYPGRTSWDMELHSVPDGRQCALAAGHDSAHELTGPFTALNYRNPSCPCTYTTPCSPRCTCVDMMSSSGCSRCCSYGSQEQRESAAKRLASMTSFVQSDSIDIGAVDHAANKPLVLLVAFKGYASHCVLVLSKDRHGVDRIEARMLKDGALEQVPIGQIADVVAYALRRAICRGIDKCEVIETPQAVTITLGKAPTID